jgi:hypothetical protein
MVFVGEELAPPVEVTDPKTADEGIASDVVSVNAEVALAKYAYNLTVELVLGRTHDVVIGAVAFPLEVVPLTSAKVMVGVPVDTVSEVASVAFKLIVALFELIDAADSNSRGMLATTIPKKRTNRRKRGRAIDLLRCFDCIRPMHQTSVQRPSPTIEAEELSQTNMA